ncbi:hypothetical protein [Paenibacillus sp. NPDC058071]|uniref:hypothetical protein n=1 Tax=Paenibacillus sp. NPDC058071 TaxID=3346326 RepID=UPI0036DC6098
MKNILVFVLFSALLCWLMFSPIYKHVLIVRQAVLQQEVDYLLEVGASGTYGYIDEAMIQGSRERLARVGMRPDAAQFDIRSDNGMPATNPSVPLPRGAGIMLTISYPYERLFEIDRLIGIEPPSPAESMRAYGMKMSEYVP